MTHDTLEADLEGRTTVASPAHQPPPEKRSSKDTGGSNRPLRADYPPKPRYFPTNCGECAKCGRWWVGLNTAHCTAEGCHRTFTTVAAFDAHRAGSHAHDTRHCLDPETIFHGPRSQHAGERVLVDAGRDYPCWGFPTGDSKWWDDGGDAA